MLTSTYFSCYDVIICYSCMALTKFKDVIVYQDNKLYYWYDGILPQCAILQRRFQVVGNRTVLALVNLWKMAEEFTAIRRRNSLLALYIWQLYATSLLTTYVFKRWDDSSIRKSHCFNFLEGTLEAGVLMLLTRTHIFKLTCSVLTLSLHWPLKEAITTGLKNTVCLLAMTTLAGLITRPTAYLWWGDVNN